jgi:predicted metalloprotease with PDZ domain
VRVEGEDAPPRQGVPQPGVEAVLARAARVELGPLIRREVPIAHLRAGALRAALPADIVALAGVALFEGARLMLDLGARRACVTPDERPLRGGFGFTIDRRRERLVITGVMDDSPAHAAGLRAGDTIVSWGGAGVPKSVAAAWSLVRDRSELVLGVERGGVARTTTLRRAHFLPALVP